MDYNNHLGPTTASTNPPAKKQTHKTKPVTSPSQPRPVYPNPGEKSLVCSSNTSNNTADETQPNQIKPNLARLGNPPHMNQQHKHNHRHNSTQHPAERALR